MQVFFVLLEMKVDRPFETAQIHLNVACFVRCSTANALQQMPNKSSV